MNTTDQCSAQERDEDERLTEVWRRYCRGTNTSARHRGLCGRFAGERREVLVRQLQRRPRHNEGARI